MEDKVEIGEYVRTKDGHIAKHIEKIAKDEDVSDGMLFDNFIYEKYKHIRYSILKEIIAKHSKQIIDLIEIGDLVEFITNDEIFFDVKIEISSEEHFSKLKERIENNTIKIKAILTKEQYENNCYKTGGKNEC